ncbi:MAG TPA: hypothetical protein VFB62_17225 [Polyangiaceae bacterium]|nr:hypothetical protein [Polyangiaceae bacterium]
MPHGRPGESVPGAPPPHEEEDGEDDERIERPPETSARPPETSARIEAPILASEALKEELAPIQPWAAGVRWWMASCGVWFVLLGLAPFIGGPAEGEPSASTVIGGIAVAGAIAPVGYRPRAMLMLMTALAVVLLGFAGAGPASVVGATHGAWTLLHVTAAVGLAAALLFGACYRAYHATRSILAAGLVATLPFVIYGIVALVRGELPVQIATGIALAAIVVSLLGFTGSEVAGPWVAGAVIATVAAQLGFESFALAPRSGAIVLGWAAGSVVAFGGASLLGALGAFMLLAARHWRRARIVDVHRHVVDRPPPNLTDSWSTRR